MGVEWHIGCTSCRRFVWLGSQKPSKWEGFQMGNAYVERFLALHRHSSPQKCELYLANDGTPDPEWELDPADWQEDILSRSFWDSYHQQTIRCAGCHKVLSDDWRNPPRTDVLRLNRGLYVCDADCCERYVRAPRDQEDSPIYDSSHDQADLPADAVLVMGCTQCKEFAAVDGAMDASLMVRDFQYLAHFLEDHVGHRELKVFFRGQETD